MQEKVLLDPSDIVNRPSENPGRKDDDAMTYINNFTEGSSVKGVYLCKKSTTAMSKAGKPYTSVILQDKTGTVDGKIWDPDSPGIGEFDEMEYVYVVGEVVIFNSRNQLNIRQLRRAHEDEYNPADYMPTSSKNVDEMYDKLLSYIDSVKAPYMKKLLSHFFIEDEQFKKSFCYHSAAKSVHHGFIGGLLEHTLSVTGICDYFSKAYPFLNRDLLITASICHDIGKVKELSPFPKNDYTDEGQLLGHIAIGAMMIDDAIKEIGDFPEEKKNDKPAIAEALALSFADNTDAKLETMREALYQNPSQVSLKWQGFNKYLDSNIRRTSVNDTDGFEV